MADFFHQNLSYFLSGISVGGQYALIAIGYTMVYGILRLINFAHGDVFMCAGLMMVYLSASLPFAVSIPLVIVLTILLGVLIERVAFGRQNFGNEFFVLIVKSVRRDYD